MSDGTNTRVLGRREFLGGLAAGGCAAAGVGWGTLALAAPLRPLSERPPAPDHSLAVISGAPRQRGQNYGRRFAPQIRDFLDKEILRAFATPKAKPDQMLRYAGACVKPIRRLAPLILDEMEGMAEGAGLRLEEVVLLSLHEELWHRGTLPAIDHCTAAAVGPPVTCDGNTYVAQSWDWFGQLYGRSQMLLWERKEGPSLLSYSYPGLWAAAGMNSAGIALTWTSVGGIKAPTLRVAVPTYVLLAHLLYQPTLDAVAQEARRADRAGWFTFVMGDGKGQLLNVEGSPEKLAIEPHRGSLARVYYGSHEMTGTPPGKPVPRHPQCQRMVDLIHGSKGKIDRQVFQAFYGDHQSTICKHFGTLDVMVYNTTQRKAYVTRGPGCLASWQPFGFGGN